MSGAQHNHNLNPKTDSFKFLGPPGTLFITLAAPATIYALYFGCSEQSGGCPPDLEFDHFLDRIATLRDANWWKSLWDTQAALIYLTWYAFCVFAWVILPGDRVEGVTMRNGEKKKYKMNGRFQYILILTSR